MFHEWMTAQHDCWGRPTWEQASWALLYSFCQASADRRGKAPSEPCLAHTPRHDSINVDSASLELVRS